MAGSDLRGLSRLNVDGIAGLVDVVAAIHHNIASDPGTLGLPTARPSRGITGLVYWNIRTVIGLVGHGLDFLLARLTPLLGETSTWRGREAALAALNGVLGDYLAATANPLPISMRLRRDGHPLILEARALAAAIPKPSGKLVVLAHGLCRNDLQWNRRGQDHGAALARDLGYTPVYLHYNSGLHVSDNGERFAALLDDLLARWPRPVDELGIVGHSMGGLVARYYLRYGDAEPVGPVTWAGARRVSRPEAVLLERLLHHVNVGR